MTSTWTLRVGTALLGALLSLALPVRADDDCGDGCCEKKVARPDGAATPQECFTAVATAMMKGDAKGVSAQLSAKSLELAEKKGTELKDKLAKSEDMQKKMGVSAEDVKKMSGLDVMVTAMMCHAKEMMEKACADKGGEKGGCCDEKKAPSMEIKDLKIDGDKATATCPLGQPLAFVKEKDGWKMDITAMLEKDCCDGCKEEKPKQ